MHTQRLGAYIQPGCINITFHVHNFTAGPNQVSCLYRCQDTTKRAPLDLFAIDMRIQWVIHNPQYTIRTQDLQQLQLPQHSLYIEEPCQCQPSL